MRNVLAGSTNANPYYTPNPFSNSYAIRPLFEIYSKSYFNVQTLICSRRFHECASQGSREYQKAIVAFPWSRSCIIEVLPSLVHHLGTTFLSLSISLSPARALSLSPARLLSLSRMRAQALSLFLSLSGRFCDLIRTSIHDKHSG